MGNIEEGWEPFEVQVIIEGEMRPLLVVPDLEEPKYAIFDQHTTLGVMWQELGGSGKSWCGEGMAVEALLEQLGEQIENYLQNKPI